MNEIANNTKGDLTRQQAIEWCRQNMADFKTPVYPPPSGWIWGESGDALVLSPIFTITDQGDDITSAEVGVLPAGNA